LKLAITFCSCNNGLPCGIGNGILSAMSSTITIDAAGRLVLPKKMRDRLGLTAGSRLRVDLFGERIELSPQEDEDCKLVEKNGVLVISRAESKTGISDADADVVAAIKADRDDRDEALADRVKRRNSAK
jgi:AbrB family looped-hinge helix DNA binding protein